MRKTPAPTGEYAVGTFTFTVYNDREEVLAPGSMRSIPARVYYPVKKESVEDMSKARYLSRGVAEGLKNSLNFKIDYDKIEEGGENTSECYENAPKIEGVKFPLVIYNHGLGVYREANSFLCLDIASHGYVVICPSHPFDSACSEADDGTKVEYDRSAGKKMYQPYLPAMFAIIKVLKAKGTDRELAEKFDLFQKKYCKYLGSRIEECKKDTLAVLKYAKENLQDIIDFEKGVGVTGHSLGGVTAYMLCLEHDEFVCGLNMDGALFGDNMGKILKKPFSQLSCKANVNVETRTYIDHTAPVYGAVFNDMQHTGFADVKYVIPAKMIVGSLDPDVAHENVCRIHLEMFDSYLKKIKDHPELESNEAVTITEYEPDITD